MIFLFLFLISIWFFLRIVPVITSYSIHYTKLYDARNTQKAGFPLTVYNRTTSKTQPFVDAGAAMASSPRDAAAAADVVLTSLMGDESARAIVDGSEGLLAGLKPA